MFLWGKSKSKVSSRRQIQIKEVRDAILVLPNNEYRVIIETSSINFELKSEAEQDVLIEGFQNFLNSLPCPLQTVIRVREVDIDRYLDQISQSKKSEKEKVYKETTLPESKAAIKKALSEATGAGTGGVFGDIPSLMEQFGLIPKPTPTVNPADLFGPFKPGQTTYGGQATGQSFWE